MIKYHEAMKIAKTDKEKDLVTEEFLREYDSYYRDKSKTKVSNTEYPYNTRGMRIRSKVNEIPISSLFLSRQLEVRTKGIELEILENE